MPTLVTVDEFKAHLGDTSSMDFGSTTDANSYLTDLLDRVEDMLERAIGRSFHTTGTITDEAQDGSGYQFVYTDRPIDTLTSIKIGHDPNDPSTTLTDVPGEIQAVSDHKIRRRDNGVFPPGEANVHITYDHQAFLPEVGKQALVEGAAFLLRRRGDEHAASTTIGQMGSTQFAALFSKLPAWKNAVHLLKRRAVA